MRQVESTDIQKFVEENGIKKYFEVSALENIGIDGMFEYIVKESVDLVIKRDWDNHSDIRAEESSALSFAIRGYVIE
jgi:hypothetical protein